MSASVSPQHQQAGSDLPQGCTPSVSAQHDARVLSVSPREVSPPHTVICGNSAYPDLPGNDLTNRAYRIARELEELIAQSNESHAQVSEMTTQLQDRLRLGAQMIKAFTAQIARLNEATANLQSQERRIEELCARTLTQIKDTHTTVEKAAEECLQKIKSCGQISSTSQADGMTADLLNLLSLMQEVSGRITQIAALNQSASNTAVDNTQLHAERSERPADPPLIEVAPPLRFQHRIG